MSFDVAIGQSEMVFAACELIVPNLQALAEGSGSRTRLNQALEKNTQLLGYIEQQYRSPETVAVAHGASATNIRTSSMFQHSTLLPTGMDAHSLPSYSANHYTLSTIKVLVQQEKVPYHLSKAVASLWQRGERELLEAYAARGGTWPMDDDRPFTYRAFIALVPGLTSLLEHVGMSLFQIYRSSSAASGTASILSNTQYGGPAMQQQLLDSGLLQVMRERLATTAQQLREQAPPAAAAAQPPPTNSTSSASSSRSSSGKSSKKSSGGRSADKEPDLVPYCVRGGLTCLLMFSAAHTAYPAIAWHMGEAGGPSSSELVNDLCMAALQHVSAHLEQLSTPAQPPASPYFTLTEHVFRWLRVGCYVLPFNHGHNDSSRMFQTVGQIRWCRAVFQALSVFTSAMIATNRLMPAAASSPWRPIGTDLLDRRAADWRATLTQQQQRHPILPAQLLQSVQEVTGVSHKALAFFALLWRTVYVPKEACADVTEFFADQLQRMISLCTADERSSLWQQLASGTAADSPQLQKQGLPLLLLCLDKTKGAASVAASTRSSSSSSKQTGGTGSSTASAPAGAECSAGGSVCTPGVRPVAAVMEEHIRLVGKQLHMLQEGLIAVEVCSSIATAMQALASEPAVVTEGAEAEMWGLLVSGMKLQQVMGLLMQQNKSLGWFVEDSGVVAAATADIAVGALRILSCSSSTTSDASSTGGVAAAGSVLAAGSGGRVLDEAHPWLMLLGRSCHQLAGTLNLDLARATASGQDLERAVRLLQVLHQAMGASVSGISAVLLDSLQQHKHLADGLSKIGCSSEHLLQLAQELQAASQAVDAALTAGAGPALAAAAAAATSSTNSSTSSASTTDSSSHGAALTSSPGECARVAQVCQAAMQVTDADAIATINSECSGCPCDCVSCQAGTALLVLHYSPLKSSLINALESVGSALCSIPGPGCCNNPACGNMASSSEQQTLSGRQKLCSGCKTVKYCCRACQKAHWKQHTVVCKALAARAAAAAGPAGGATTTTQGSD